MTNGSRFMNGPIQRVAQQFQSKVVKGTPFKNPNNSVTNMYRFTKSNKCMTTMTDNKGKLRYETLQVHAGQEEPAPGRRKAGRTPAPRPEGGCGTARRAAPLHPSCGFQAG